MARKSRIRFAAAVAAISDQASGSRYRPTVADHTVYVWSDYI
jgi:hypothetical protein